MRTDLCALLAAALALSGCDRRPGPPQPSAEVEGSIPRPAPGHNPVAVCRAEMAKEKETDEVRTFWPDCPRVLRAPDGRRELFTMGGADPTMLHLRERKGSGPMGRGRPVVGVDFPNGISWAPSSDGFFLNDSEGSGQSSYFRYFEIRGGKAVERSAARNAAVALYKRLFKCTSTRHFVYTQAEGWSEGGDFVSLKIWPSHRSDGCALDPFSGNEILIVVDPRTGRIFEDARHVRQRYFGGSPSTAG